MQATDDIDISVIIPCYNLSDKIGPTIRSLERVDHNDIRVEVIFVDDCSKDGTFQYLKEECRRHKDWRALQLAANSGSPSRPRNVGLENARGRYLFFLDGDDELISKSLRLLFLHAREKNACVVRGFLLADRGGAQPLIANRILQWDSKAPQVERLKIIIEKQSTTPPGLIRTDLLRKNNIRWDETAWMGEDTLFLVDVLSSAKVIEYIDEPTYIYNQRPSAVPSATQQYGERELTNHLYVWRAAASRLRAIGVSYNALRLQVAMQAALHGLIWRNRGNITPETFADFASFVRENWPDICRFNYTARLRELLVVIRDGDFSNFKLATRIRLVIAGYDPKFARPLVPLLEERFEIRFDEWAGHNRHNVVASKALLEWGEVILCEWLLGNAVWYSENKKRGQILLVRMHRFELGREFGDRVKADAVDAFFAVSVTYFERLIERFGYDRRKIRLLPNLVYPRPLPDSLEDEDRLFNLAIIGILPAEKGFLRSLMLLASLRAQQLRYRLHVFGKVPKDLDWILRDQNEVRYFSRCDAYIEENSLKDAVIYHGFVDVPAALEKERIGFVLSTSGSGVPPVGFESFHLAPAEGIASGAEAVILRWDGCEFVFPPEYIHADENAAAAHILERREHGAAALHSPTGRNFISERYNGELFVQRFLSTVREFVL
jgi:glycosyltransferase involved in cell wall biosynthesis